MKACSLTSFLISGHRSVRCDARRSGTPRSTRRRHRDVRLHQRQLHHRRLGRANVASKRRVFDVGDVIVGVDATSERRSLVESTVVVGGVVEQTKHFSVLSRTEPRPAAESEPGSATEPAQNQFPQTRTPFRSRQRSKTDETVPVHRGSRAR